MYYNTTDLKHAELNSAVQKAKGQDEIILEYFKAHPNGLCTPFEVHSALFDDRTPVDSIKRTLNTLTKELFLEKTKTMRMGKFGRLNHTWKLKTQNSQPTLF